MGEASRDVFISKGFAAYDSGDYGLAVRMLNKAIKLGDDSRSEIVKERLNEAQKRLAESSSSSSSSSSAVPTPLRTSSSDSSESKTPFTPTTPYSPQPPPDEANREAAEQCAARGAKAFEEGDSVNAVRLLSKALRMCPTLGPKVRGELQAAEQSIAARAGSSSSAASASDGVRKRQMGAAASPSASTSAVSYTPEMVEIVKQVKKAKDLYGVLGVARDADEDAIKKAYKKLALKVHPDKNTAPGSDEAFKRVGKANAILLDPNERANYDRFGEASEHSASSNRGGNSSHDAAARQYYARQQEQEISPEDIFNAFFGPGGLNGMQGARVFQGSNGRVHFQRGGGNAHHHQQQQQQQPTEMFNDNTNIAQRLQGLMPLIFLFIFFASSMFGSSDEQYYALQQSRRHSKLRTTNGWNNIAKGLPYFVTDSVDMRLQSNQQLLYEVELNVQNDLKRIWSQNCRVEEQEKQSYLSYSKIAKSRSDKDRYLKAHREFKQPSCENMKNFFSPQSNSDFGDEIP